MHYDLVLINILEDSSRRKNLVDLLLFYNPIQQECLFENYNPKAELDTILDNILFLMKQEKSLYQTWMQELNGKVRKLSVPNKPLRQLFEKYFTTIIKSKMVHERCHGAEPFWSVKRSLETHLPCSIALSFDLKSAFENVPMNLADSFFSEILVDHIPQQNLGEFVNFFSYLSTVNYCGRRGLPQGSPISGALFNRLLYSLDSDLNKKVIERGFRYSRWVDDFTITSPTKRDIRECLGAVGLVNNYFPISENKVFFQDGNLIYLLGYKIVDHKQLLKNTKEEKEKNKVKPLDYAAIFERKSLAYSSWD